MGCAGFDDSNITPIELLVLVRHITGEDPADQAVAATDGMGENMMAEGLEVGEVGVGVGIEDDGGCQIPGDEQFGRLLEEGFLIKGRIPGANQAVVEALAFKETGEQAGANPAKSDGFP